MWEKRSAEHNKRPGEAYSWGSEVPQHDEKKVGFVFQKTAVFPWKTVMQNVEFSQELKGVNKARRREQAQYLIELVGLKGI